MTRKVPRRGDSVIHGGTAFIVEKRRNDHVVLRRDPTVELGKERRVVMAADMEFDQANQIWFMRKYE